MDHNHVIRDELGTKAKAMREAVPEVFSSYAQLSRAAMSPGALGAKEKELIGLAIAATRECDGCVVAHARGAARAGATSQEVAEAMGVVILMNGGPGTVWGPRAFAAYSEASQ
jgi:AhpD family alkylhydroperoxidase